MLLQANVKEQGKVGQYHINGLAWSSTGIYVLKFYARKFRRSKCSDITTVTICQGTYPHFPATGSPVWGAGATPLDIKPRHEPRGDFTILDIYTHFAHHF